jgi:hypothetical protein
MLPATPAMIMLMTRIEIDNSIKEKADFCLTFVTKLLPDSWQL